MTFLCRCAAGPTYHRNRDGVRSADGRREAVSAHGAHDVPDAEQFGEGQRVETRSQFTHARLQSGHVLAPTKQQPGVLRAHSGGSDRSRADLWRLLASLGSRECFGVSGDTPQPQDSVDHQLLCGVDGLCRFALEPGLRAVRSAPGLVRVLAPERGGLQGSAVHPALVSWCAGLRAPLHLCGSLLHHRVSTELQSVPGEGETHDPGFLALRRGVRLPVPLFLRIFLGSRAETLRIFPPGILGWSGLRSDSPPVRVPGPSTSHLILLPEGSALHLAD